MGCFALGGANDSTVLRLVPNHYLNAGFRWHNFNGLVCQYSNSRGVWKSGRKEKPQSRSQEVRGNCKKPAGQQAAKAREDQDREDEAGEAVPAREVILGSFGGECRGFAFAWY
jgi:hypothetical protein